MSAASNGLILVTGAAGKIGGIGPSIVEQLRHAGCSVRALVRTDDDRAARLRHMGAEVIFGSLTNLDDCVRALQGVRRAYFGLSVSAEYLEATMCFAAAAKHWASPSTFEEPNDAAKKRKSESKSAGEARTKLELLVNISQFTVSQMSISDQTESPQQRMHWLAEQALNWSGLPVVHVRPSVFLEHPFFTHFAAESIRNGSVLRFPLGTVGARTNPIAAGVDVSAVAVTLLTSMDPSVHVGRAYNLTGAKSVTGEELASEYSAALGREIKYEALPVEEWQHRELIPRQSIFPAHVYSHFLTMSNLHSQGRYDRETTTVTDLLGRPATSITEYVKTNITKFT